VVFIQIEDAWNVYESIKLLYVRKSFVVCTAYRFVLCSCYFNKPYIGSYNVLIFLHAPALTQADRNSALSAEFNNIVFCEVFRHRTNAANSWN
jgi:hypothetical protein